MTIPDLSGVFGFSSKTTNDGVVFLSIYGQFLTLFLIYFRGKRNRIRKLDCKVIVVLIGCGDLYSEGLWFNDFQLQLGCVKSMKLNMVDSALVQGMLIWCSVSFVSTVLVV